MNNEDFVYSRAYGSVANEYEQSHANNSDYMHDYAESGASHGGTPPTTMSNNSLPDCTDERDLHDIMGKVPGDDAHERPLEVDYYGTEPAGSLASSPSVSPNDSASQTGATAGQDNHDTWTGSSLSMGAPQPLRVEEILYHHTEEKILRIPPSETAPSALSSTIYWHAGGQFDANNTAFDAGYEQSSTSHQGYGPVTPDDGDPGSSTQQWGAEAHHNADFDQHQYYYGDDAYGSNHREMDQSGSRGRQKSKKKDGKRKKDERRRA